jgi:GntR family transcriptional regulator
MYYCITIIVQDNKERSGAMQWQLRGDRPIYQQLMEQLTERIVSGQLGAGGKVPPVRELAAEAGVNPNTMQRALAEMEREGLLYTNRTSGRYVTEDKELIGRIREQIASDRITEFLAGMNQLGFTETEIISLLEKRSGEGEKNGAKG